MEFNKTRFEQLMGEAVSFHSNGEYQEALTLSKAAYAMAPDDSFEKGRAARDTSARYDRLGDTVRAEHWASEAYDTHNHLVNSMEQPSREAFRERSVSAMYVGVNSLRKAIQTREFKLRPERRTAVTFMRQAWSDIQTAKAQAAGVNRFVDQYEINASRRVSMTESLLGDRSTGLRIGMRAVSLAFLSESRCLDTSNPDLVVKDRLRAKVKALAGSIAALGVGILASPRANVRSRAAWALTDAVL